MCKPITDPDIMGDLLVVGARLAILGRIIFVERSICVADVDAARGIVDSIAVELGRIAAACDAERISSERAEQLIADITSHLARGGE